MPPAMYFAIFVNIIAEFAQQAIASRKLFQKFLVFSCTAKPIEID
jgi:hypothetical protein